MGRDHTTDAPTDPLFDGCWIARHAWRGHPSRDALRIIQRLESVIDPKTGKTSPYVYPKKQAVLDQ